MSCHYLLFILPQVEMFPKMLHTFSGMTPFKLFCRSLLRQEIGGLQAKHLQLASYLHLLGREKDGLQPGHLQLASCLHFLRQELGGLQFRHLQSATSLLSEMEVTTETG